MFVAAEEIEQIKGEMPELPHHRRVRLLESYNLNADEITRLARDVELCEYFESAATASPHYNTLIKFLLGEVLGCINELGISISELQISPCDLAELINTIESGEIQRASAKKAFVTVASAYLECNGKGTCQIPSNEFNLSASCSGKQVKFDLYVLGKKVN